MHRRWPSSGKAKHLDIALPRSRVHTVHQAGHMVHYANFDGIIQAVDELEMETVGSRLTTASQTYSPTAAARTPRKPNGRF